MEAAARVVSRAALLALALVAGLATAPGAAFPDGPSGPAALAPWEAEVEHETETQTQEIEDARQRKSLANVVARYQNRLTRDPSALNHYLYGRALYYAEDPVGARRQMSAALAAEPRFWYAHLKLAVLFQELANPAERDAHLAAVLAVKPGHAEALKLSANAALDAKDWEKGIRILEALLTRYPADLEVRQNLAMAHYQRKDWEAAARELRILRGRAPANARFAMLLAAALLQKGDPEGGVKEAEDAARLESGNARPLKLLLEIHASRGDWARLQATYERLLPLLSGAELKAASEALERLRAGPPAPGPAETAPKPPTIDQLVAACQADEPAVRREALRHFHRGILEGAVREVPPSIRRRVTEDVEPDAQCRSWVVQIEARLMSRGLVNLSFALSDRDRNVRMLAVEAMGDIGHPAGLAYLLPRILQVDDPVEVGAIRNALARLTGRADARDRPPPSTAEEVEAIREEWRRWRLSDESVPAKVEAVKGLVAIGDPIRERYLAWFALDNSYETFREAYLALRDSVAEAPSNPLERKTFPRFPRVPDAELTRPGMRAVQDRVLAWWNDWLAERAAWLAERSPADAPPAMSGN